MSERCDAVEFGRMTSGPEGDWRKPPAGVDPDAHAKGVADALDRLSAHRGDIGCLLVPLSGVALVGVGYLVAGWPAWARAVACMLAFLSPAIVWSMVLSRRLPRVLNESMRARGIDVCDRCGYRLDGTPGIARCPECGRGVDEMVARDAAAPVKSPVEMPPARDWLGDDRGPKAH